MRLALHTAVLAAVVVASANAFGCRMTSTVPPESRAVRVVAATESTEVVDWGSTRRAPEMDEALARVQEDFGDGYFAGDDLIPRGKLGTGRFLGAVVSWVLPGAKIHNPPGDYAEVMVTVDGRLGPPPHTSVPFGFVSDGSTYGQDGAAMSAFKRDAVRLADSYVGRGLVYGPEALARAVEPYVSAYVLEYAWGAVVITPALEADETAALPEGGWPLITPLPASERRRLDSMSATEVAQTYVRNERFDETFWLLKPESRYDFIAFLDQAGPRTRRPGATVRLAQERVGDGFGYGPVKSFIPSPALGDDSVRVTVGRRSTTSPWRVTEVGH